MNDHARALKALEADLALRNAAPSTRRLAFQTVRPFLAFVEKRVRLVTAQDVREFLAARERAGVSAHTQAHELVRLRRFFQIMLAERLVREDPTERLRIVAHARPPIILSRDGVSALLRATGEMDPRWNFPDDIQRALSLRDRALIELLYCLGLRASEASAARLLDLDLSNGVLVVRRAKRGESRAFPLPPSGRRSLERYVSDARVVLKGGRDEDDGFLLLTFKGKPMAPGCVLRIVQRISKRAGVRAHPHAFRRTVATHLVRESVSVEAVRQLLGHARLTTTETYVAVDMEELRAAVEPLEQAPSDGGFLLPHVGGGE